ncbi:MULTISPECIES: ATP-binding protein [unclassified Dehalobacter]|uniref:ATP-binding protein n=1 Tax=unclassified Dehalobacter TaxID=2635733 RepID=UPI0003878A4B|nr:MULTISPECIES: ATP-binding protein [unclassified Dehalobacter]EQB22742.1 Nucleotidyltransferase [Dehalobacter sp. UNSWDHB]MDJ0304844.1 ATP-binding protein [Dehalobacter sp.]
MPVWALSADDWAVLLHASEKTQIPIIKRAIDIARIFYDPENTDNILKNHIVASTIIGILNSSESSPSSSDKIKTIITTFGTDEIKLDRNIEATGKKVRSLLNVSYGQFTDIEGLQVFCEDFLLNDVNERITRSNNVVYDIVQFKNAVDFAILYEGSISSQRIQEYTATLSTRLQALIDSDQGRILTKTSFSRIDDYVESILGTNQIVNIDISSLDDSSSEVVVKVITKLFFDHLKKMNKKADMPVNLIIEEAHRFVRSENHSGALNYNIFERVAKEGRKYGLLLGISSQRPSELSKTVVSQCSNFIIHRVQNPDDLSYISRMVPYISEGIINRLTYLQTGNALIFGTAINLPTLAKFERANPPTDSHNARISEKWYTTMFTNENPVEELVYEPC